jgi:hypothetical protein
LRPFRAAGSGSRRCDRQRDQPLSVVPGWGYLKVVLRAVLIAVVTAFLATSVPSPGEARPRPTKTSVKKKPAARKKVAAKAKRKPTKKKRKSVEKTEPRRPMP